MSVLLHNMQLLAHRQEADIIGYSMAHLKFSERREQFKNGSTMNGHLFVIRTRLFAFNTKQL